MVAYSDGADSGSANSGRDSDAVFRALADPSRRLLLDSLNGQSGQTLGELCGRLQMSRQAVSKHLAVLEAANLVTTLRRGREKLHYVNAEPINAISDRWIRQYDRGRARVLADLTTALEETMSENEFVYTSYIEAPQELVWRAITERAFTREYWGMEFDTDWTPGSNFTVIYSNRGVLAVNDPEMTVSAYEPYDRLSYSWVGYSDELAASIGLGDDFMEQATAEPRSTVTFTLEPSGTQTKLVVVHSGFRPGSVVLPDISRGWPIVISSLKTFLESGAWEKIAS